MELNFYEYSLFFPSDEVTSTPAVDRKRKHSIDLEYPSSSEKKMKLNGDDDVICL